MLSRLAPKLADHLCDTELLEHIGSHQFQLFSVASFNKFQQRLLCDREAFCGDANDYVELLVNQLNQTFEKVIALGEFTRSRPLVKGRERVLILPLYLSITDRFLLYGIFEKITNLDALTLLVKPLSENSAQNFAEVRKNALIEFKNFKGAPREYATLQLAQLHLAVSEVIALHLCGQES